MRSTPSCNDDNGNDPRFVALPSSRRTSLGFLPCVTPVTVQMGFMERTFTMGIFDKAKDFVAEHDEEIDKAIDKVADVVEDKVPEKHAAKVEEVAEKAKGFVDKLDSGSKAKKPN